MRAAPEHALFYDRSETQHREENWLIAFDVSNRSLVVSAASEHLLEMPQ